MSRAKAKRTAKVARAFLVRERLEAERRKLQRASAVLLALVHSLDRGLNTEQASDVASTVLDLVEQAVDALDSVALTDGAS